MKKRIISLLLALVTVLQMFAVFPVISQNVSGLSIEDMEVGVRYKARFRYGDAYLRNVDGNLYRDENSGEETTVDVTQDGFPTDLIVMRENEGKLYVRIINEDWPAKFENYRYVDEGELIILEKIEEEPKPTVKLNGQPVQEIALYEDGKMPLTAVKPAEIKGDVAWEWEILVGDTWICIGDKTTDTCDVTYALVVNALDANDEAQLRAVAVNGDKEYESEPITIKMKRVPKPLEPEYDNVLSEPATYGLNRNTLSYELLEAGDEAVNIFTITVNFIKVLPDGTQVAESNDRSQLQAGYEAFDIKLRSILGYYPSLTAPSNPYDFSKNPAKDPDFTAVTIEEGHVADYTVNVYYYPGEANYRVYHYVQNIHDDNYTQYSDNPVETKQATVDKAIPDCHLTLTGFQHLYYEHTEVAVDGSTVVEIYYDREYYPVQFMFVHDGAYGQEDLYVKYGTKVSLNNAICVGWKFSGWVEVDANGNEIANPVYKDTLPEPTIVSSVIFKATWTGEASSYSVVYWFENADNGLYTIRYSEKITGTEENPVISGTYAKVPETLPATVTGYNDYEFFTLDEAKNRIENRTQQADGTYVEGVVVQGDGSTTVNVYFARRYYNITFVGSIGDGCTLDVHTHGDGTCEYNPMFCTHVHSASCKGTCTSAEHTHTASCLTCTQREHLHTAACCGVHVHDAGCYSVDQDMVEGLTPVVSEAINQNLTDRFWGQTWITNIVNLIIGNDAINYANDAAIAVQGAAPPQNLQNGYVYVLEDQEIDYYAESWLLFLIGGSVSGTVTVDIPAVYIDGEWYYYTAPSGTTPTTGTIVETDKSECEEPDHDHTGGCDSVNCANGGVEHVHTDASSCYGCGTKEHEHSAYCTCAHEHTMDCYGNLCMKPEHNHNTNHGEEQTIRVLQAKYGQDITAYVPYFLELTEYNLQQNTSGEYFTYWKYDSTGTDTSQAIDRYVKHMTMVPELCYSNGITTRAQYSSNVEPYVLYYLFESFDQSSAAKDYGADGSGRQQLGGKYYDSDPIHMQFIMLDDTDSARAKLEAEGIKTIAGMIDVSESNPLVTPGVEFNGISFIRHAYFYDRILTDNVIIHNNSQLFMSFTKDANGNGLKYGASLYEFMKAYQAAGVFDFENIPYPSNLEPNAYEFDGFFTTTYRSEQTRIDWETTTLPEGDFNIYAHWKPLTRYVHIYEDSTKTKEFDNNGYQQIPHGNTLATVLYTTSEYIAKGYTFDGWYYFDSKTNTEKRFYFPETKVTSDLELYAKWKLDKTVPYQIHYVYKDENGVETKIADSIYGTAVVGQNKTFLALAGNDLYSDYNEGYFPQVGSHTVLMEYNNTGTEDNPEIAVNEYIFYYDKIPEVNYWIEYIDNETGEALRTTQQKTTTYAAVTERFLPVESYTVDKYAKTLILSTQDQEENNVIRFIYTKNEEAKVYAHWVVNHMMENPDGTYYIYHQETGVGEVIKDSANDIYNGTVRTDIVGYTFKRADGKTRTWNEALQREEDVYIPQESLIRIETTETNFGYELNEYGIEINLYYDRDNVSYRVEYRGVDKDTPFYFEEYTKVEPHGNKVTANLVDAEVMKIIMNEGYDLIDPTVRSISLTLDIDESRNVITFLFQKYDAEFYYEIVCGDENSGVDLLPTRDVIAAGEIVDKPRGSTPFESETYYFAGWYADKECTLPINAQTIAENGYAVTLDENNHLTPIKTQFKYTVTDDYGVTTEHTGNLYRSATYYALFLPRSADLKVTVNSGEKDTFILTFTGDDTIEGNFAAGKTFTVAVVDGVTLTVTDVPIGIYKVTLDQNWSWRYPELNDDIKTVMVAVQDGGTFNITLAQDETQWLTSDAIGVYQAD